MRLFALVGMMAYCLASSGYSEVISFTDEDVKQAPILFKTYKESSQSSSVKEIEPGVSEETPKEEAPQEIKDEKEEEVIDSFVVFKGNRRYHLATCKMVGKNKGARTTVNGAKAIEAKYVACSSCGPKAYKDPPKPKKKDEPEVKVADKKGKPAPKKSSQAKKAPSPAGDSVN